MTFRFCDRLESDGKAFPMLLEARSSCVSPSRSEEQLSCSKNPSLSLAPLNLQKPPCLTLRTQGFSCGAHDRNR